MTADGQNEGHHDPTTVQPNKRLNQKIGHAFDFPRSAAIIQGRK
jgi:hypothetical protein